MKQFKESHFHEIWLKVEAAILSAPRPCALQTHLSTLPLHTHRWGSGTRIFPELRCWVLPMAYTVTDPVTLGRRVLPTAVLWTSSPVGSFTSF